MSDTTLNRFVASGTTAERTAFTPTPPTPASGPDPGYLWWDTDTQTEWSYDFGMADWVELAGGAGSGTVTNTGTLTDHALIVGNGGVDVSALGSLGTTTTVLHGNAAGDPTFGAVALATDVSGDLPFANLTQIAGLSVLGVTGSATADVAAITAATDGHVLKRVSSSSMVFAVPDFAWIEQQTPTGTGTATFSSLGSFTHLRLLWNVRSTDGAASVNIALQFNADTGANYDFERVQGSGATASATEALAGTSAVIGTATAAGGAAGFSSSGEVVIYDYAGTTFQKNATCHTNVHRNTTTTNHLEQSVSVSWRSTNAITSITVLLSAGNYDTGSKLTLYGMK